MASPKQRTTEGWTNVNSIRSARVGESARERRSLKRQERPVAAGTVLANTQMVGVGMAGSSTAIIRETRRGQAEFMAERSEEPPAGSQSVRSSGEAGNDRGAKGLRKVDA